jgi:hypothetical protein
LTSHAHSVVAANTQGEFRTNDKIKNHHGHRGGTRARLRLGVCAIDAIRQRSPEHRPAGARVKNARKLQAVTVTGSLIPQTAIETATPILTITAEQMKARGFSTVAEALQQSSFATGSVQGSQTSAAFTQGAQTLSLFGLPVGFVKYLIDGKPMGNFPGLYNGSDAFNNISGIPADLVDHIDILPGGQSSSSWTDLLPGLAASRCIHALGRRIPAGSLMGSCFTFLCCHAGCNGCHMRKQACECLYLHRRWLALPACTPHRRAQRMRRRNCVTRSLLPPRA